MINLVQFLRDRFYEEARDAWAVGYVGDVRVLREVASKRLIVDHVVDELADLGGDNPWWYEDRLMPILKYLALSYADHPDYRDEEYAP